MLPNLVIAGVVKGGTTSVFTYLSQHPDICASSKKETCYFLPLRYGDPLAPVDQYLANFSRYRDQPYVMEATPGYFEGGSKLAQAMQETLGSKTRVIVILREPIERLFSFYNYQKAMLNLAQNSTFDLYIEACQNMPDTEVCKQLSDPYWGIKGGFYAEYIDSWFDVYEDSLKVFFFDQLKSNPAELLQQIYAWLKVEPILPDSLRVENKTVNYKNAWLHKAALSVNMRAERVLRAFPDLKDATRRLYFALNGRPFEERMTQTTRAHLRSVYEPYNRRLAAQLTHRGYRDLPYWLSSAPAGRLS
ncbi:MAG: sulfotransferase domain-containing protein [Aphanocapsa lilacina HA4352-LM1]|nr:sulfotransferase domain-containing protein [Aphanocapsa lilacina HA4352-LM1]